MGVDVPHSAVLTTMKEHLRWQKLIHRRSTPEHRKYKYSMQKLTCNVIIITIRSQLKEKAHKRHEEEKNHMATLQAVGVSVSHYTGHSVSESDDNCTPEEQADTVDIDMHTPNSPVLEDTADVIPDDGERLLFFYDCETTGGSCHKDHIMEIASVVIAPDDVNISKPEFTSLCHTSRHIVQKGFVHSLLACTVSWLTP